MALDGAVRVVASASRRPRLLGLAHGTTRLMASALIATTTPGGRGRAHSWLASTTLWPRLSRSSRALRSMHMRLTSTRARRITPCWRNVVVVHLLQPQVEALFPFRGRVWGCPTAALLAFPGLPACSDPTGSLVAGRCLELRLPCGGDAPLVHVASGVHHAWLSDHFWNGQEAVVRVYHSYCYISVPCKGSMNLRPVFTHFDPRCCRKYGRRSYKPWLGSCMWDQCISRPPGT